ncbi:MAG: hypothetical protein KJZ73_06690 [Pseudorhodoplanes sp.]|nr:hypothetical protein [Pseudorhodoplanes sp.]MBW7950004.1 hypothetical protein [Pseudorhodoplanes sp.]MCL4710919.1 hypothetical protein [Pseudorhodoplanes sp.]GIK80409.1 MAG: hypothetical protein BroJett024_15140 [Alphaproteobacteria bacterium]
MSKNILIIVGADKGGVGKTTVSRTLIDYFAACRLPIRAFDTESPKGNLQRFHPNETEVVDITSVFDQMRILDTIRSANKSTLIDVRAGYLSLTLQFLQNIGFLEALKRAEVRLVLLHVLSSSISSLGEIEVIRSYVPEARYYLVKNFINEATFFKWDPSVYESFFQKDQHGVEISIPKLNEVAYERVESAAVSFLSFIANKNANQEAASNSFVLRGYVRHWLGSVWSEFDRIKLCDIVEAKAEPEKVASQMPFHADRLIYSPM